MKLTGGTRTRVTFDGGCLFEGRTIRALAAAAGVAYLPLQPALHCYARFDRPSLPLRLYFDGPLPEPTEFQQQCLAALLGGRKQWRH